MKKIWNFETATDVGKSQISTYGPIKMVWLNGNSNSRLSDYAQMHKQKLISDKPIHFFGNRFSMAIENEKVKPAIEKMFKLWNLIALRQTPRELQGDLQVLYDAYGKDLVQRGSALPDLAGQLNGLQNSSFGRLVIPELGCTSIVKKDGKNFFYGRNLDFDGTALLDMYPSIVVHRPERSDELCYASFTSDSMPLANISGVNEAGITLSLHKNYSNIVSLGTPVLCIGELVLRKARTLEGAIDLLNKHRPGPAWTYVLTDLYNHRAIAVETSKKCFAVREMQEDHLIQANHFMNPETQKFEFSPPSTYENSLIRYEKIQNEIASVRSFEDILELLGYQSEDSGELSAFYDIAKPSTLLTYGFENRDGKIRGYFSGEEAPTSTGCLAEFELERLWKGPAAVVFRQKYPKISNEKRTTQIQSGKAFYQYFDNEDFVETLRLLGPQNSPTANCVKAVCLFNLRDYQSSINLVDEVLEDSPWLMQQNMLVIKLMALTKLKRKVELKKLARETLAKSISIPKLQSMCESIVASAKVEFADQRIRFDFSSGQLLSKPEMPSKGISEINKRQTRVA